MSDQLHPTPTPDIPRDFERVRSPERVEYEQLSNPELRYKYVKFTEGLIARAIAEESDALVFLDKSARPVAWLMKALWPTLGFSGFDEQGKPIPAAMPAIKFANIDREQWAVAMGRSEGRDGKGITLEGVHPDTIDSLTGLFATRNMSEHEYVSEEDTTLFDHKNVLIIDEVMTSGDTLTMATKLFERAFPDANSIRGTYWMTPEKKYDTKSGGTRNADLPIWYNRHSPYGRLVANRDDYKSGQSVSMRQRRGAQFLSTRFDDSDTLGLQLRREMQQLGRDVTEGRMPVTPNSKNRPDDDEFVEKFMNHVNHLSTLEFAKLLGQSKREHMPFPTLVDSYKTARNHVNAS